MLMVKGPMPFFSEKSISTKEICDAIGRWRDLTQVKLSYIAVHTERMPELYREMAERFARGEMRDQAGRVTREMKKPNRGEPFMHIDGVPIYENRWVSTCVADTDGTRRRVGFWLMEEIPDIPVYHRCDLCRDVRTS